MYMQQINGGENVVDTVRLKKLRCAKGYFTQTSMAKAMSMKPANYGNTPFTADDVVKICGILGLSLEEGMEILL